MIPLDKFVKDCKIRIADLGRESNGSPILGMCQSLQPLNPDGSIQYTVYVSTYMCENDDVFTIDDLVEVSLHEKLHLYCLSQFGIETKDSFIDYWISKIRDDYI